MGTTKHQRREIEDMENLAAILDTAESTLQLLTLYIRQPHLLDEIERALRAIGHGKGIVIRPRTNIGGHDG